MLFLKVSMYTWIFRRKTPIIGKKTWLMNWPITLIIPNFQWEFQSKKKPSTKTSDTKMCVKKVSEWKMSFLRIKKSSKQKKQKRHCRKTVATDLLSNGTVSLRLLDFQKVFNRRIKNTMNKPFTFHRNIESMEMRFGKWVRKILVFLSSGSKMVSWRKSKFDSFE